MDIEIPHIQNDPDRPFTIASIFICHWQTMKVRRAVTRQIQTVVFLRAY